jgi:Mn2+/Fe2+ NRAMP family transporter
MVGSQVVSWCIIATAAATLHAHGVTHIGTATEAAEALRPLAGKYAYIVFAIGIIATGFLSVPTLAGSAAYAVSESSRVPVGLNKPWREARGFYGVIVMATLVGVAFDLLKINPIEALYYSAVINGVVAPPLLVIIMLMGNNPQIMRESRNKVWSNAVGWTATAVMTVAAIAMVVQLIIRHH